MASFTSQYRRTCCQSLPGKQKADTSSGLEDHRDSLKDRIQYKHLSCFLGAKSGSSPYTPTIATYLKYLLPDSHWTWYFKSQAFHYPFNLQQACKRTLGSPPRYQVIYLSCTAGKWEGRDLNLCSLSQSPILLYPTILQKSQRHIPWASFCPQTYLVCTAQH